MTYTFDIIFIIIIRWYLNKENKRRDAEKEASGIEYQEFGYIERQKDDGSIEKFKVPIALLDVTDGENQAFRYVL